MEDNRTFDVIIIGGSYSGLSAAMALGRSLRSVLIIDGGQPCNSQTPHSHNFITHDGEKPKVIFEKALEQVLNYKTVHYQRGFATAGSKVAGRFEINTNTGQTFSAKKLIFATGVKDIMPEIPGFSDCWGISVIHCPYCHGYEFSGQKTAIMANGERAFHLASLVCNLTDKVTLLTRGSAEFSEEQYATLRKNKVAVTESDINSIEHEGGHVKSVLFQDGHKETFAAIYAVIPFLQHSAIPASMGCEITDAGHLKIDMFQKTNIAGVFACGDNSSMLRSVAMAVMSGNVAGAMANSELASEAFNSTKKTL